MKIFKKLRTFLRNSEEISEKLPENFWETPRKLLKNPKKYLENPKNCRKWVLRKNLPLPHQCPKTCRKSEKIFVEILSNSEGNSEKFWENFWEILRNISTRVLNTLIHNYYDEWKAACDRMWKKGHSFAEQDYFTSMWSTFSVCLFRSAEIIQAISLALVSASHSLANFSGFTGFFTTPNG